LQLVHLFFPKAKVACKPIVDRRFQRGEFSLKALELIMDNEVSFDIQEIQRPKQFEFLATFGRSLYSAVLAHRTATAATAGARALLDSSLDMMEQKLLQLLESPRTADSTFFAVYIISLQDDAASWVGKRLLQRVPNVAKRFGPVELRAEGRTVTVTAAESTSNIASELLVLCLITDFSSQKLMQNIGREILDYRLFSNAMKLAKPAIENALKGPNLTESAREILRLASSRSNRTWWKFW
jgi:hypothetical protein